MKRLIFFLIVIMALSSCVINYQPLPSQKVKISDKYAILKTDKYTVIVDYRYWIKTPQNLSDYFTTFYLTVINNSKKPIIIKPSDIYLLDQNGTQYDVVPIEDIYNFIASGEENYRLITNEKEEEEYKNYLLQKQEARKNIMNYSFSFGKLVVGARKTGYLFFNKLPSDNKQCKIIFKGHTIKFIRTK